VAGERVQRRPDGREVRSAVELTRSEREIAYKIVKAFNMNVCGFDILRCGEKSYVCDVNGWSFVKGNEDYYDSCAAMLCDMFRRAVIMGGASKVRPGPVSVNRRMGGRTTVYHKNR
jgi:inositol-hexakisphosphate/diphosphoinositol-pentakisphosphate 1-kinase